MKKAKLNLKKLLRELKRLKYEVKVDPMSGPICPICESARNERREELIKELNLKRNV